MNIKLSLYVVGTFMKFFGLLLLIPAVSSLIYRDGDLYVFLITAIFTSALGLLITHLYKELKHIDVMERKEAFLITLLCWLVAGVIGAIPYILIPVFSSPIDAIFESISGFTTTGATVISDVEKLPHGLLFYRSFTQWLGGMGIIVLGIAILPKLSVGGIQLLGSEAPGPITEKLTPKIADTAKKLWFVYVTLSLVLITLLYISGMPVFDSIVTAFSTLSTGGFSIKNSGIASYNNSLIEAVITIFMFLSGISFLIHYYFFTGKFSKAIKSSELKFYILLVFLFIVFVILDLWLNNYVGFLEALRYSSFQVVSILTTTGFHSTDFDLWPAFSIFILLTLMFIGACAGSTSGSVKVLRILIMVKEIFLREVKHLIKPHAVLVTHLDKKPVTQDVISSVTSFILLYIFIFVISVMVILAVEDISLMGALSACAASIGNVGPGFQEFGATHNYQFLTSFSKLWLCALMLIGRLELFTILVLFSPLFWRK